MILIETYITQDKLIRQSHLKLDEPCVERGGNSENYRGLLAHLLDTSIPKGQKIHLCHACHNSRCGNPNHLYWGTSKENTQDRMLNGGKTIWENTVEKYGLEVATSILKRNGKINGAKGGAKKGRNLSTEHKAKISANHRGGRSKKINADVL